MEFSKISVDGKKGNSDDLRVAQKLINLQQSAQSRGLEFDLSFETVKELLSAKRCYYTGVKLSDNATKDRPGSSTQRTIDRIDNSLGYIEGNVVACSVDFNGKKGNLTLDEIETLYFKTRQPLTFFGWIRSHFYN